MPESPLLDKRTTLYAKWHYWNRSQHNGWVYEVIEDVGSGLNYQKKGLRQLITRICSGEIERLVITHKDRLLRFGSELVFSLCEHFGTEVVIVNASEDSSFEGPGSRCA